MQGGLANLVSEMKAYRYVYRAITLTEWCNMYVMLPLANWYHI